MKFNSQSVTLKGGCRVKFDVYIPSFILDYEINDSIWQTAIDNFNKELDKRQSVTTKIDGVMVDVLKLESVEDSADWLKMGAVILLVVTQESDLPKIKDIHFCLTGHLTFAEQSGKVDGMVIENITYGGSNSKAFKVLNDSVKQQGTVHS